MKTKFTVACYQGPPKFRIDDSIDTIKSVYIKAQQADVILFPETFLQGYFESEVDARKSALTLNELDFLSDLKDINSTIILGLNEKHENKIYNSAIIVESGKVINTYRKFSTYPPYDYFDLCSNFPVFVKNDVTYGVCICCDINYTSTTKVLVTKGAQIVFFPMWNIVDRGHSLLPHMHNKTHLQARASDNRVWLVCSDVIYSDDKKNRYWCQLYN